MSLAAATACSDPAAMRAPEAAKLPVALPEVSGVPLAPYTTPLRDTLVVTPHDIMLAGTTVIPVMPGALEAAQLKAFLAAHYARRGDATRQLVIAIDKALPYDLLLQVLKPVWSKALAIDDFALVVLQDGEQRLLPIPLGARDRPPSGSSTAVRLVVSLTPTHVELWSFSQLEPAQRWPLDAAVFATLQTALDAIAARRWDGRERPPDDEAILLQANAATPIQRIAQLLAAVRPRFPVVMLSSELE